MELKLELIQSLILNFGERLELTQDVEPSTNYA
jgi:hypothetical protein